jgi:hypothetical protein
VSDGGLAEALAEASAFSEHLVDVDAEAPYGSVIVSATEKPDWPQLRELGRVA